MIREMMKKMGTLLLILGAGAVLGACTFLFHPKFGETPNDARLDEFEVSPNFEQRAFINQVPTPQFTQDVSLLSVIWSNHFTEKVRPKPKEPVPTVRTDLRTIPTGQDTVVWLGHSAFYMQLNGKRILIDPVFSDHASPLPFVNQAFDGTTIYGAEDMPEIDYLLISHDHYDHLDYDTVTALRDKVRNVVVPLGVGSHFTYWGYPEDRIIEADWYDEAVRDGDFAIYVLPARHYSGRLLTKKKTLWSGFALETAEHRIFFGGDSGYGPHYREIGDRFAGFDIAILDSGQYDSRWAKIHMTPEEATQAAIELKATALLPAHVGRFQIANHPWDEPFERAAKAVSDKPLNLLTPQIGEPHILGSNSRYASWWESIE